jgi:hypothetical protein
MPAADWMREMLGDLGYADDPRELAAKVERMKGNK